MIQIVFENENFVVCDKACGQLSTPSRHEAKDARGCLGTELQAQLQIQIYPVHRLDFEVSGLVMYAKNPASHREGNAWFENKTVRKSYGALTRTQSFGHIPENVENSKEILELAVGKTFEWQSLLLRGKRRAYESPVGKNSLTMVEYLGTNEKSQLQWKLNPVTGRPHQLRFEMSRHGFAIIGDRLYGSQELWRDQAIALRAYGIDFSKAQGAQKLGLPEQIILPCWPEI